MATLPETVTCMRCRMTFRVQAPHYPSRTGTTTCTEPGCGRRFWHADNNQNTITIGMWPEDVEAA